MFDEELRNRRGLFRRDYKIDIAHNFPSPPITSRNIDLERIGMPSQISPERLRFGRNLSKLKVTGVFRALLDRGANLGLRRFAKARQLRHSTGLARLAQLLDRANVELLVKRFDLLRAKSGD